ncbi:zinc dependent phospholipase C family protein [Niabella aurantiaca]|uniref:zinc dependent phospholipase C family protein n=1 Tax=Niabella aurantiaca TaxID=379900 RepID=UPI00036A8007|nr:zinc dependent phospholipase C family protein [Niabella aurantiaca]
MKQNNWIGMLLMVLVTSLSSWGFLVHRTVNQLAIYGLPKKMQPFFYTNIDSLVFNAPRPDQRRNVDPAEGNKHFLDGEYYGEHAFDSIPRSWDAAVAKYSEDTLKKYGTLPYVIGETQKKLTEAFKKRDGDSIIFYATDLGHYIGDAHVPLHTSLNYDGQLTGQRGMHDLWETSVPEAELTAFNIRSRHKAKYLGSVETAIWDILKHTHALLPAMFAAEKEVSKSFPDTSRKYRWEFRWGKNRRFYSKEFAIAFNKVLKGSINDQLIRSSNALADFWYTAWVDAGKPDLNGLLHKPYQRHSFRKERKAYRKDQLIKKGWLISNNFRTRD